MVADVGTPGDDHIDGVVAGHVGGNHTTSSHAQQLDSASPGHASAITPTQEDDRVASPHHRVEHTITNIVPGKQYRVKIVSVSRWGTRELFDGAPTIDFTASINNRDTDGSPLGGGSQVEVSEYGARMDCEVEKRLFPF